MEKQTKSNEARSTAIKDIAAALNAQGQSFINCSLRQLIMFHLYAECSPSEQEVINEVINNLKS